MVHGGRALARTASGEIALVSGALPGETVVAELAPVKGVLQGSCLEVISPSSDRVTASPHPGLDYSFMAYERQLVEKRAVVNDALSRAFRADSGRGGVPEVPEVVAAPAAWAYRNTVQPAVTSTGLGYRRPGTDEVIVLETDPSATEAVARAWQRLLAEGVTRWKGVREIVIRGNDSGEALVALVATGAARDLLKPAHALIGEGVVGVVHAPYDQRGRFRSGAERLAGARTIVQRYGDVVLTMNAMSFAQPNPAAAGDLYRELTRWAGEGETALELFAGGGAIAFHLAKGFRTVSAIEIDRGAVARGRADATRLGVRNVEFLVADARDVGLPPAVDLIVVDPPRAGLSAATREALVSSGTSRLLYVSCDVATWARDVADLSARGFVLKRVLPYDFYPQTHHVEILSELERG